MAEIEFWHSARTVGLSRGRAARGRRARIGARMWTWLHADALILGTAAGLGDAAFAEDDRRRLAAWRASGA